MFKLLNFINNLSPKPTNIECLVCNDQFPSEQIIHCTTFISSPSNKVNTGKVKGKNSAIVWLSGLILRSEENFEVRVQLGVLVYFFWFKGFRVAEWHSDDNPKKHAFCTDCICGSASAAVGDVPMAKGGIGLRYMMPECDNPILYSELRVQLSDDLQIKLEERILHESIGLASIQLERCKKCNFAIEMEVDKEIDKVFDCLACGYQMCRICERDWDDEHFGISCKELDKKEKDMKDKQEREIEKQLNEAIVRKCPRCGIQFMKELGCNKMTCRCGMSQCYICRQSGIGYDHFCPHVRDPQNPQLQCKECKKTCLLHEDAKKKDEQLLKEIRERSITV